uniref:Uncharacterized protein n=1 Tax=Kalanchoe fedtschenkoi TaxID=63787 RepID=A0A7N0T3V8_KALFE
MFLVRKILWKVMIIAEEWGISKLGCVGERTFDLIAHESAPLIPPTATSTSSVQVYL